MDNSAVLHIANIVDINNVHVIIYHMNTLD